MIHTDVILDSITDGVFTVDKNWRIMSFNLSAQKITGVPKQEAVGKHCCEVFKASICETGCALKQTMHTGKSIIAKKIYIIDSKGQKKPISISTALLKDKNSNIIGGVETFRDLSIVEELRKELKSQYSVGDLISKNHKMREMFKILPEIAKSNTTVLIEGESGVGKELLARAIHTLSMRSKKPFVAVNCGALPDTLLESELFGYKAGAFTDAKKDKPGRFARAKGGTLFLDEIGDISTAMQVKLLRVIQEKVYEPLGAVASQKTDVRIISATNKHLADLVEQGVFRQDLFYRINVIRLTMPPLRQRREDIPLLVEHFIHHFNRLMLKNIQGVSMEVLDMFMHYDFPGNIRELENIMEHSFVLCSGNMIQPAHLPDTLLRDTSPATQLHSIQTFKELEKYFISDALRQNKWNRLATARFLGIHKSTLFRKIKALDISMPNIDGRNNKGIE